MDSDVLIWVLRDREETVNLLSRIVNETGQALACSALSVLEIESGARPAEIRNTRLFLDSLEVLSVDRSIARLAGELLRISKRNHPREWIDSLIAATALRHHLTLLTYNRKDYPYRDLKLYPIS